MFSHDYWESVIDFSQMDEIGSKFKHNPFSGTQCTGYAFEVLRRLGHRRVRVVGYATEDNPDAMCGADAGGHDFAIVDGRFIVDGWRREVDGYGDEQVVFDLEADRDLVSRLYGNPKEWIQHHSKTLREHINRYARETKTS